MSRLTIGVTMLAVSALAFSLTAWLSAKRDVQTTRRELVGVTKANEFLKKTLGDMTMAITAKDRQIDQLLGSGCDEKEKTLPSTSIRPDRTKVPKSKVVRTGDSKRSTSAEGAAKRGL